MRKTIVTILLVLTLSYNADAQNRAYCVTTYMFEEGGEFAMSPAQYAECRANATVKLAEMGACVKVKSVKYSPTPDIGRYPGQRITQFPISYNLSELGALLRKCSFRKKYFKRPTFCVALLPQTIIGEDRYVGGVASSICSNTAKGHSGTALVRAGYENRYFRNRKPHCPIALAHEIGHLSGAFHHEFPERNIMNTGVSAYVGQNDDDWRSVQVLPQTVREIADCKAGMLKHHQWFKANKRNRR